MYLCVLFCVYACVLWGNSKENVADAISNKYSTAPLVPP